MEVTSNNNLQSNIELKKVEVQKEIKQCNASLDNIENKLKNSHLSRITKGKLLENRALLIERINQLHITLIRLNTLSQALIARQNAPRATPVLNLQNRVTIAPLVQIQEIENQANEEIEEESTEKEEIKENKSEVIEEKENSLETVTQVLEIEEGSNEKEETSIPSQETIKGTRSLARPSSEDKPLIRGAFSNSSSITSLFSLIERTFFYMTGLDSRRLFDRSISPFNQTLIRRLCISFGASSISLALSFLLFRGQAAAAGSLALATTAAPAGSTNLWDQYKAVQDLLRHYLKFKGHSLEWCMRHGPKISQELYNFIVEKGLMKKHW